MILLKQLKTSQVTLLCLMILQASISSAFPQQRGRKQSQRRPFDGNSAFVRATREDVAPATAPYLDEDALPTEAPAVEEAFIPLGEIPLEGDLPASFAENFEDAPTEAPAVPEEPLEVVEEAPVEEAPVEEIPAVVEDVPAPIEDVPVVPEEETLRITPVVAEAVAVSDAEEPAAEQPAETPEAPEVEEAPEVVEAPEAPVEEAPEVVETPEAPVEETINEEPAVVEEQVKIAAEPEEAPVQAEVEAPVAPPVVDAVVPPAKSQKPQKQTLYNVLPPLYGILYPLKPTGTPAPKAASPAKTAAKPSYPTTVRPLYPPPAAYRPVFPVSDDVPLPSPTYKPSKTVKPAAETPVTNYPRHQFGVPPTPRGLGFPTIQNTRDNLRFDVNWSEVGRRQRSAAKSHA